MTIMPTQRAWINPGTAYERFHAWKAPFASLFDQVKASDLWKDPSFLAACKAARDDRILFMRSQDDLALLASNVAHLLKVMDVARKNGFPVPDLGEPPTS